LRDFFGHLKVNDVSVVEAREAETMLPPACCDSIVIRHVYHHFPQPAQENASLFASLKPGGLLAVVDFPPTPESSAIGTEIEIGIRGQWAPARIVALPFYKRTKAT
jgi:predicted methyltransferase